MDAVALPRRVAIAATGIAALMSGWLVLLHLRMIISPAPQEMREGGIIWITSLLLSGRNPYAVSELPASTNAYGILYHLVVLPFARIFGNGYTVHRAVSAIAIVASSVLMYRLLRRERADRVIAAVGMMLFYASSLYFVAPLARPDGLGMLLAIGSMTLLFRDDVTPMRFSLGLLLALLALVTKVYLAFPPFVMATYVFLFVSPRRGLIHGLATIAAATAVLLTMTLFYPAYINVSIVENVKSSTYYDVDHMKQQTWDWLLFSLPLVVAFVAATVCALVDRSTPRMLWTRPSILTFATVANAAAFLMLFAGHPGAHMTYIFQLVTPVLILSVLPRVSAHAWPRALVAVALPIAFALNAHYFPLTFGQFRSAEAAFEQINSVIAAHENVLASTEIAGPLALAGRSVFDSGHSQYFGTAAIGRPLPGLVPADNLHARWEGFLTEIASGITSKRFDLVLRNRRNGLIPADLLADRYVRTATFEIDFPWGSQRWPIDAWEPR